MPFTGRTNAAKNRIIAADERTTFGRCLGKTVKNRNGTVNRTTLITVFNWTLKIV
jgi:hypothetical protein